MARRVFFLCSMGNWWQLMASFWGLQDFMTTKNGPSIQTPCKILSLPPHNHPKKWQKSWVFLCKSMFWVGQWRGFSHSKCCISIIGFLRGGCPRGGGNWGTLRIPRDAWGLGKIRGITTHPRNRILLMGDFWNPGMVKSNLVLTLG